MCLLLSVGNVNDFIFNNYIIVVKKWVNEVNSPPSHYNFPNLIIMQQVHSCPRIVSTGTVQLPSLPKPPPGIFTFAHLSFLNKRVSQCYGCGKTLKQGGHIPHPPEDMVITTML